MRAVSERYLKTVPHSHSMVARARLCTPGQEGTNPGPIDPVSGGPLYPLSLEDGDVFFNAGANIRGKASITVSDAWPLSEFDMLFPNGGAELYIERGIVHGDGVREWVGLGYFRLDKIEQEDAPNGPVDITASDRMAAIVDAQLITPRQYRSSETKRSVIEDLVLEIHPTLTVSLLGDIDWEAPIGVDLICDRDRYQFLNNIARAHACVMWFDYTGAFIMCPVPNYDTARPVWTVKHGADGVLVKLSKTIDRAQIFNAVVVDGEQASGDQPVRGVAYNLDPNSPTRWNGPFKQVPYFWQSALVRTDAQARAAAEALLARRIGSPYVIDFDIVPNSALEVLDLINVEYDYRFGVERHVLDTLQIPLVATRAMSGTSRVRPTEVILGE